MYNSLFGSLISDVVHHMPNSSVRLYTSLDKFYATALQCLNPIQSFIEMNQFINHWCQISDGFATNILFDNIRYLLPDLDAFKSKDGENCKSIDTLPNYDLLIKTFSNLLRLIIEELGSFISPQLQQFAPVLLSKITDKAFEQYIFPTLYGLIDSNSKLYDSIATDFRFISHFLEHLSEKSIQSLLSKISIFSDSPYLSIRLAVVDTFPMYWLYDQTLFETVFLKFFNDNETLVKTHFISIMTSYFGNKVDLLTPYATDPNWKLRYSYIENCSQFIATNKDVEQHFTEIALHEKIPALRSEAIHRIAKCDDLIIEVEVDAAIDDEKEEIINSTNENQDQTTTNNTENSHQTVNNNQNQTTTNNTENINQAVNNNQIQTTTNNTENINQIVNDGNNAQNQTASNNTENSNQTENKSNNNQNQTIQNESVIDKNNEVNSNENIPVDRSYSTNDIQNNSSNLSSDKNSPLVKQITKDGTILVHSDGESDSDSTSSSDDGVTTSSYSIEASIHFNVQQPKTKTQALIASATSKPPPRPRPQFTPDEALIRLCNSNTYVNICISALRNLDTNIRVSGCELACKLQITAPCFRRAVFACARTQHEIELIMHGYIPYCRWHEGTRGEECVLNLIRDSLRSPLWRTQMSALSCITSFLTDRVRPHVAAKRRARYVRRMSDTIRMNENELDELKEESQNVNSIVKDFGGLSILNACARFGNAFLALKLFGEVLLRVESPNFCVRNEAVDQCLRFVSVFGWDLYRERMRTRVMGFLKNNKIRTQRIGFRILKKLLTLHPPEEIKKEINLALNPFGNMIVSPSFDLSEIDE